VAAGDAFRLILRLAATAPAREEPYRAESVARGRDVERPDLARPHREPLGATAAWVSTTTLPPCTSSRCLVDEALGGAACAGLPVPASVVAAEELEAHG
jgi:hypothetical protein